MSGSWSCWRWGKSGNLRMLKQGMDESYSGTNYGLKWHSGSLPGWICLVPLLRELQEHLWRQRCCCRGPRMWDNIGGCNICTDKQTHCWNWGIGITIMLYASRALSKPEVVLKKSFQTSTGYIVWLSTEHFNNVTTLSWVSLVGWGGHAWDEMKHEQQNMQGCGFILILMQTISVLLGFTACIQHSYQGTGNFSDGKIAQGCWGVVCW